MSVEMVEAPVKSVTFVATRRGLRLVIEAKDDIFGPGGKKVGETKGRTIEFQKGTFQTSDPEEIEILRSHELFNVADDGFLEVAPLVPDATPLLQEIAIAAAARDVERVAQVLADEEVGHRRETVLETARAALQAFEQDEKAAVARSAPAGDAGPSMKDIRARAKAAGVTIPFGTSKDAALALVEQAGG